MGGRRLISFPDGKWEIVPQLGPMFGPLVTPHDLDGDPAGPALKDYVPVEMVDLRLLADFLTGVLPRPHNELGRSGAVCPYSAGSLRRGMMSMTACRLDTIDDNALLKAMSTLRKVFLTQRAAQDVEEIFRSVTVVFPHLPVAEGSALIDRVQKFLKRAFIDEGLMVGEFYPDCPAPGVYNAAFRPLQTPVVCLSIRHMTVFDAPFMIDDDAALSAFLLRFGGGGENHVRNSAANRNCPQTTARVQAVVASQLPKVEARI